MDIPGIEYIVVCREDRKEDGTPGEYTLVTRTIFPTKEAADKFASECASERQALVVGGRFSQLRHDFEERFPKPLMTDCAKHGHTEAFGYDAGVMCKACFIGASRYVGIP
jgi:hypothetical protein